MAAYDDDNYQPQKPTTTNKPTKRSKHFQTHSSSGLFANAIKEGWVLKKGPQKLAGWKKRYLQLSIKQQLGYYIDESMVRKKGTIFLNNLTIHHIKRSSKTSGSKHHGFCVVTPNRTYQFCVASSTDRDHWIQKIREIVDDKWDAHKIEKPSISYTQTDKSSAFSTNNSAINNSTINSKSIKPNYGYNDNAYGEWDEDDEDDQNGATFKIKQNMLKDTNNNHNFAAAPTQDIYDKEDRFGNRSKYNRNDNTQTELTEQEAQQRIQMLENKNDELLDEALKTTYDTQNIAADTAVKLDEQRHQLINVDKNLHEIDQDLDKTEGLLDGMKSWSGMIKKKFKKDKVKDDYIAPVNEKSAFERNERKVMEESNGMPTQISEYEADNKQNEKLDELLKNMKALNKTAQDINQELDEQGAIIDAIGDKMDKVAPRIGHQNKTMQKICK